LHLLQLLKMLARVNFGASCLVVIEVFCVGYGVSPSACDRGFGLASNLAIFVF